MEDKFIDKTNKLEEELLNIKVNHVSKKVIDHISQKLVEIEDRSRRNNIRIDGIPESYKESWDDCEKKVQDVFTNRLGIENVEIERAHRVAGVMKEGTEENNDRRRPRTIVLKLLSYKDKVKIFRTGPAKWFSKRGGQIVSFLKKCRPPWLADEENFRVYFALDGLILNCLRGTEGYNNNKQYM